MRVMKLALIAFAALLFGSASASAITVKKRTEAPGLPPQIWEIVGDFCAIKSWHPAVEDCVQTKEGDVVFRTGGPRPCGVRRVGKGVLPARESFPAAAGGPVRCGPPRGRQQPSTVVGKYPMDRPIRRAKVATMARAAEGGARP